MNALILLVVAATIGVTLYSALNRKTSPTVFAARKTLYEQASRLDEHSIDEFLKNSGLTENKDSAHMLLAILAGILKVEPEKLAHNYHMKYLLIAPLKSENKNEQDIIDPFSHELLEKITNLSEKKLWEQRWHDTPELPRDEDALADFVIKMTVSEFLQFFSPLMKPTTR